MRPGKAWELAAGTARWSPRGAAAVPEGGGDDQSVAGCFGCSTVGDAVDVERAVEVAEGASSHEEAAGQVRPASAEGAVTLPSALRWLRRRMLPVRAALLALVTLPPELFGCRPTVTTVRERLGMAEVLVTLRALAAPQLAAPLGFRARATRVRSARPSPPHEAGPDPPGAPR